MSRPAKRTLINHRAVVERLRSRPNRWLLVGEYRSCTSADGIARLIRSGYEVPNRGANPYRPAGAFEARKELSEFGVRIYARYIGINTRGNAS